VTASCAVPDCGRKPRTRGWCNTHYERWRIHGTTELAARPTADERFWAKVDKTDGCWNWTASTVNGYGSFWVAWPKESTLAHCYAYRRLVGVIPEGLRLDHICRNPRCVRPSHLRLATAKQNSEHVSLSRANTSGARGVSWSRQARKWHAYVGHNGRRIHVGFFTSLDDAEAAARRKRNELFTHNDLDRTQ